jgi:P27 family predicted phage terminase small subunit
MPEAAVEKWHSISRELEAMGVLAKIDGEALACLCVSWARWVEAQAEITKRGLLIVEPIHKWDRKKKKNVKVGTRVTGKNPAIAVAQAELKNILRIEVEFGLTPASRSKLSIAAPRIAIEQDQFDKYADRLGEINRVN